MLKSENELNIDSVKCRVKFVVFDVDILLIFDVDIFWFEISFF